MPIQYEPARDQRHYAAHFGLACPAQAPLVRPGGQGLFIRRPRADREGSAAAARFEIAPGRWGLIPLFAKEREYPFTFEARGETAASERNFYQPWKRGHRCVILADALFRRGDSEDSVVRVSRADGQPLAMAGLWNGWRSPEGECVESFALLTLPALDQRELRWVVFLREAWIDDWLHCPVEETAAYLRPYALDKLVRRTIVHDPSIPLPERAPAA
ncbi:Putative SOS response-associated peptidase YedK [Variovorax sp. CF079]|uniref:SOS response-associated peptidase family protein n=1 Tax=Variovorax sp. CF079 TaxID=1882774 RepID=UPI0008848110|nr:SOS response-associated peptidase family protein [Variovorax sp. CF079]SDD62960.1 Putative SOS response-associated peptidase YedK [Variovorax sp. CF079]